jgi:folate-binding protein YgfZ
MSETIEETAARRLPLEELHRRAGASLVERDGWLVPARYGDAAAEYEAVRGVAGAGLFDLSTRGRILVGGREAVQFLNGLITNDVKTLPSGAWMSAAFPNPQGRLLAFARVSRAGDEESFLFDTEPATHAAVFRSLERFTLAGDFKVKDLTDETAQLSLQGARAAEIVGEVFGEACARLERGRVLVSTRAGGQAATLTRATHTGEDGYNLIVETQGARELWDALVSAGARPSGYDALEVLRVEAGVPRYGVDVSEANVVTEAGLDDAVSYTKGCYVGQEIIARIHWRGHVAKKLAGLLIDDEGANESVTEATGGEIKCEWKIKTTDGAREIGRVTSSIFSPRLRKRIALGIVKYDFLAPGTEVLIESESGARRASVASLPFVRGGWYEDGAEAAT